MQMLSPKMSRITPTPVVNNGITTCNINCKEDLAKCTVQQKKFVEEFLKRTEASYITNEGVKKINILIGEIKRILIELNKSDILDLISFTASYGDFTLSDTNPINTPVFILPYTNNLEKMGWCVLGDNNIMAYSLCIIDQCCLVVDHESRLSPGSICQVYNNDGEIIFNINVRLMEPTEKRAVNADTYKNIRRVIAENKSSTIYHYTTKFLSDLENNLMIIKNRLNGELIQKKREAILKTIKNGKYLVIDAPPNYDTEVLIKA